MITISDEELDSINRAILTRYGIDFSQYESVSLKRRVGRIISKFGFQGIFELWRKLLSDPSFIRMYIDELTVGLTEMFRNPELWLKVEALLKERFAEKKLSIWHAGCSTGEEVYTMCIVLQQAGRLHKCKILATDINESFLEKARLGVFSKDFYPKYEKNYALYNPNHNLSAYFQLTPAGDYQINQAFSELVCFETQNLIKTEVNTSHDFIFCRNVLIYFDEALKIKIINKFAEMLSPNGVLVLGYYDALPDVCRQQFSSLMAGQKIFVKNSH